MPEEGGAIPKIFKKGECEPRTLYLAKPSFKFRRHKYHQHAKSQYC